MNELTLVTLILVFTIPVVMVILTLVSKQEHHRWLCLAGIGLMIVGLLLLGVWGESDIDTALNFMGEPITFSISNTAIMLFVGSLVVLGILILTGNLEDATKMTPYQWSMLNLSFSFGFIAFISGQFMVRYIALDIVGLLAALTVLSTFTATWGLKQFIIIFQILRLGDLSLLASILLINHRVGTLDISQMINAAVVLPRYEGTWVFLGFLIALLVKLAIWPFGIWLERARKAAPYFSFWVSGVLVPALGYYLLYRIIPIINSTVLFQNLTVYSAITMGLLILVLTALRLIKYDRFTQLSGVMSCFLLAASAFGGGQSLLVYLLALILHRCLLLLDDQKKPPVVSMINSFSPLFINGFFVAINWGQFPLFFSISWLIFTALTLAWDITMQRKPAIQAVMDVPYNDSSRLKDEHYGGVLVKAARWLNQHLEQGVLTLGISRFSTVFHNLADWLYQNVEQGFEKIWIWIGRKLISVSEGTWKFEQRLEKVLIWVSSKLLAISEETLHRVEVEGPKSTGHMMDNALNALETYEQNVLKKALRWDLAWIPLLLVVILIMLFVL